MNFIKTSLLIRLLFSPLVLFAANEDIGDCKIFDENREQTIRSQLDNIYPNKNVKIAIKNLKNYCCNNSLLTDESVCKDKSNDGASSNHLYDHLIDVGFRSLDGEKDLYYTAPEELVGDTIGEERKKKITEYATNPLGAIPLKIRTDFGKYWGFDNQGGVKVTLNTFMGCDQNNEQYAVYNTNRNKNPSTESDSQGSLGLAEKYLILCHFAQCIRPSGDPINNHYQACEDLALQRIHDEMGYVQIVTIKQGLAGLVNNFNSYAQGYFVQGQLRQLLEKITEMNAGLTHIDSKVHEMTKMCSK